MKKERADKVLVGQGLAATRQKAQALIMAGLVSGPAGRIEKAGQPIDPAVVLTIAKPLPYVGRGGFKLEQALDEFAVSPQGLVCADIGSSTGGFTDCLLQRGAARVFAVDVDIRQLDDRLRRDPRVVTLQKNARNLVASDFPAPPAERPMLFVMDVSFISILKILPALRGMLSAVVPRTETSNDDDSCRPEEDASSDVGTSLKRDEVATHFPLGSARNDEKSKEGLPRTCFAGPRNDKRISLVVPSRLDVGTSLQEGQGEGLPRTCFAGPRNDGENQVAALPSVARNDEKIALVAPSRLDVGASLQEGQEEGLPRQRLATTDQQKILKDHPILLTLIKPQFEAGRGQVGKKGIVRDPALHAEILARVAAEAGRTGFALRGLVRCSTHGRTGNQEFFARWEPGGMEPAAADMLKWIGIVTTHEPD